MQIPDWSTKHYVKKNLQKNATAVKQRPKDKYYPR